MSVTTTSSRAGKFESRFWHKLFEEEVGRVKGHLWVSRGCLPVHLPYFKGTDHQRPNQHSRSSPPRQSIRFRSRGRVCASSLGE